MLRLVAAHEFRLLVRRRGYGLLLALFAALVMAAAVLNAVRQQRDRAQQLAYQQLVREQWENQPDRHPHRVAHYGTFAFKAPGPLAGIDPGVESYAGRVQFLEAHRQNAANFAEAGALSSVMRFGELSLAFVLQLVLPLVVIVLGHRVLAEERETGRLRLLLGQGARPAALRWGKLLGLGAAVAPFVLLAAAGGAATVALDPAGGGVGPRLALLAAATLLHLLAWLGLTVWVSGRTAQPAHALAVLVALWLGGNLVLPRAAGVLGAALHPLPDKSSFTAAVERDTRALGDPHDPDDPNFAGFRARVLERFGVARVEDLPVNWGAVVMAYGEELGARTFARHFDAFGRRLLEQARWVDHAALLAPSLAFRRLSTAAAGTDLRAQLVFQREAESFRYAFVQELNALHRDLVPFRGDRDTRLPAEHWRRFADFRPPAPPLAESLAGTAPAWFAAALWALLPLALLSRLRLPPA
jgi:ABC-2 type transport system permease protein